MGNSNGYLSVKDIEAKYGISKRKLYRRIDNGSLPVTILNGIKMINESDICLMIEDTSIYAHNNAYADNPDTDSDVIDLNNVDTNNPKELTNGINFAQKQSLFLRKIIELDELRGLRDKPNVLNRREEELNQRELELNQRELELNGKSERITIQINKAREMFANAEQKLKDSKVIEEKANKREQSANDYKKVIDEDAKKQYDKINADLKAIEERKQSLDFRENGINDRANRIEEEVEYFTRAVNQWRSNGFIYGAKYNWWV